jgi:hypothetical protein
VQPLPTIHTSHKSLENLHRFETIFKIFARAVFEAIEVKRRLMLNFLISESLAANLEKVRQASV